MKLNKLFYTLVIGAALGVSHISLADGTSDAAQSKSGAGPGSTGSVDSTAPSPSPAMSGTDASTSGTSAPVAPTVGDPGAGKSGLAPGSNANPVGTGTEGK